MNDAPNDGPNDKVYIHEFIDIIGHNRANYMHHMTANWSPIAQDERHQLCYGDSFEHEFNHPSLQDPKLAKWWSEAANYRRHGDDRVLIPAPWMPTIEQLCATGTVGETYAHEQVHVPQGTSRDFLEVVAQEAIAAYEPFGWQLVGAWETAMVNESECFLMWAIPSWAQWGEAEAGERTDPALARWRRRTYDLATKWHRFLLVDAPLSPMRIGRQPSRDDRHEGWDEG